jgi:hypothetical protein
MSDEQILLKLIQYSGCVSCYFIKRLSKTESIRHSDLGASQNAEIVMGVDEEQLMKNVLDQNNQMISSGMTWMRARNWKPDWAPSNTE